MIFIKRGPQKKKAAELGDSAAYGVCVVWLGLLRMLYLAAPELGCVDRDQGLPRPDHLNRPLIFSI